MMWGRPESHFAENATHPNDAKVIDMKVLKVNYDDLQYLLCVEEVTFIVWV